MGVLVVEEEQRECVCDQSCGFLQPPPHPPTRCALPHRMRPRCVHVTPPSPKNQSQ